MSTPPLHYALAYLRTSKDEQHLSPFAQSKSISDYAHSHAITVLASYADLDTCSITPFTDRPHAMAMVEHARSLVASLTTKAKGRFPRNLSHTNLSHANYQYRDLSHPSVTTLSILVAKRDRLARDIVLSELFLTILPKSVTLISADGSANGDTPNDVFMRQIVGSVAQLERANIRARTKAALAALKAQGRRTGSVPYGYRLALDGTSLELDPSEQSTRSLVHELAALGYGRRRIATELASRGVLGRTGKPLQPTQVYRLLHVA